MKHYFYHDNKKFLNKQFSHGSSHIMILYISTRTVRDILSRKEHHR